MRGALPPAITRAKNTRMISEIEAPSHNQTMAEINSDTPAIAPGSLVDRARALAGQLSPAGLNPDQAAAIDRAHAVEAALAQLSNDDALRAGALLHPLCRAQLVSQELVAAEFGPEVAGLVKGLEKLSDFGLPEWWRPDMDLPPRQAESLRQMLVAIASDIRLVLARLAEQLVILEEQRRAPATDRRRAALETREIFAPLANRLGIWQLKWQLEDLAFRALEPEKYRRLVRSLRERRDDRVAYLEKIKDVLRKELAEAGVIAEVTGRPKHLYSIWRKMQRKHLEFNELFDIRAVRILVDTVADCYAALGVVHGLWPYLPGEFDDYIATPKENGYRSLHTAVIGPGGHPLEVQIRTHEMHQRAELGVAAHWRYKEGRGQDAAFDQKIHWLRSLLEPEEQGETAGDLIDRVRADILDDRVYVISPRGDIVDLPAGATPLDFAYHVHSEVGHHCRGAKVNGRMVPLTYRLKTGEQVEIITAKNSHPSRDWLVPQFGYMVSPRTRAKVRSWFRRQDQEQNRRQGRAMLEKELGRLGMKDFPLARLVKHLRVGTAEEMFVKIGSGDVSLGSVAECVQQNQETRAPAPAPATAPPRRRRKTRSRFVIAGLGDLLSNPARCCGPMPPEPIRGYLTQGRGVSIHRRDCANLLRLAAEHPERILEVAWQEGEAEFYPVRIRVAAHDRAGLTRDVTGLLADENVSITALDLRTNRGDNSCTMDLVAEVRGLEQLSRILNRLSTLPNVTAVNRADL